MRSSHSSESTLHLNDTLKEYDVHLEDGDRVCWNHGNQDHPRNWGLWSKYYTVVVISWLEMYMTGISSSGVHNSLPIANYPY